jgi:P27 family predicted phage terminase small subunit
MPRGGQNIKSKEHHAAVGNLRPVRHANRLEEQLPVAVPPMPDDMDLKKYGKDWQATIDKLLKTRVISEVDTETVRTYVEALVEMKACRKIIDKEGMMVEVPKGWIVHPLQKTYDNARNMVVKLAHEFGFTHRSRMSLKVANVEEKKVDPFDALTKLMNSTPDA